MSPARDNTALSKNREPLNQVENRGKMLYRRKFTVSTRICITDCTLPVPLPTESSVFRKTMAVSLVIVAVIAFFKVSVVSIGTSSNGHPAVIWKDDGTDSLRVLTVTLLLASAAQIRRTSVELAWH